jgi:hypothetical protein
VVLVALLGTAGCASSAQVSHHAAAPNRPTPGARVVAVSPSTARVLPVGIDIPALGLSAGVMALGLDVDGTLQVPPSGFPAGWYTGSPAPGETGPAVLAGHVDWAGKPGVFSGLPRLRPGDLVVVRRADSTSAVFAVSRVVRASKTTFPTAEVYGDLDHPGLRLITCGGAFNRAAHHYEDNVIVFADLVTVRRST